MRKCRIYTCYREAAEGSEFCRVKHGWQEVLVPLPQPRALVTRRRVRPSRAIEGAAS